MQLCYFIFTGFPWFLWKRGSILRKIRGLFTSRGGYPSKRANPSWRAKDSSGLQAKFHGYPGQLKARLHPKDLETSRKLTRVGGLTLPGVFTREKVNPSARVTLACR